MRLGFLKRYECKCECGADKGSPELPPSVPDEPEVSRTSPARLLARSLTEPDTRGEWEKEWRPSMMGAGGMTEYTNAKRDLKISRGWWSSGFSCSEHISTPFTLSKVEEKMVKGAMDAFDRHQRDCREAEALSRLTAPREGLKPVRGETPKSGSTAKRRKPDPKGRAQ